MAGLKVTITIKTPGRHAPGVLARDLPGLLEESYRFLRSLGSDFGLDGDADKWFAQPKSGSVAVDYLYDDSVPKKTVRSFNSAVRRVVQFKTEKPVPRGVSRETLLQFAKLAEHSTREKVSVSTFAPDEKKPTVVGVIAPETSAVITATLDSFVEYFGAVQGTVHSINFGEPNHFQLRELASGALVRCTFTPEFYDQIIGLLKTPRAVVLVSGEIEAAREPRAIINLNVSRVEATEPLSDSEFMNVFGSAPNFTGDLTTEEFRDRAWHGE